MASSCAFIVLLLLSVAFIFAHETLAAGESVPEVTIQNRFKGCQPRVECDPYEDDVLFHYKEEYRFTFDVNPTQNSISCTVQCTGEGVSQKLVTFVGAQRGTSTKYFQWRLNPDGGYVRWLDAKSKVTKKFTKLWSF